MDRAAPGRLLRGARIVGMVAAIGLVPFAIGSLLLAQQSQEHQIARLDANLANVAGAEKAALEAYFARARSIVLVSSRNPAFRSLYGSGDPVPRIPESGRTIDQVNAALGYLEELYPDSIGEACFIDGRGPDRPGRHRQTGQGRGAVARRVRSAVLRPDLPHASRAGVPS